jgi:hypothetical protein
MPPKKVIYNNESNEVVVSEPVTKAKKSTKKEVEIKLEEPEQEIETKKVKTKKAATKTADVIAPIAPVTVVEEPVKKGRGKKAAAVTNNTEPVIETIIEPVIELVIEESVKKGRGKKVVEKAEEPKSKPVNTSSEEKPVVQEIVVKADNTEYNALKAEWVVLCEKIKEANKEKELLETQKNQLLNKLWKLGETSYPKTDKMFNIMDKPKSVPAKVSSIQTKILDNDSSDSDSSDSESSSESEVEPKKMAKKKIPIKKADSDSSDSDSD